MSAQFCILIPSKIFQVEKQFFPKFAAWFIEHQTKKSANHPLPKYSILPLSEFRVRQDINLDLPEQIYHRYHVIDFQINFLQPHILQALLLWLANIYKYGKVGLLKYWSDELKRFPPVTVCETEQSFFNLSPSKLPLDKVLFSPLITYLV